VASIIEGSFRRIGFGIGVRRIGLRIGVPVPR
jgi:hypothetical protein